MEMPTFPPDVILTFTSVLSISAFAIYSTMSTTLDQVLTHQGSNHSLVIPPDAPNGAHVPVVEQVQTSSPSPPYTADRVDTKNSPWQICLEYAKDIAEGEVAIWRGQVKRLLLFASLFSGVAGAFAIESYHNVKQDPTEITVLLLKNILALQMNATNPQTNLPIDFNPQAPITAAAKRINTYHFLSLILSLSAVLCAFLCLQWLDQYELEPSGVPGSGRECLGVRYMRAEGMKKWHVFTVLATLPLIFFIAVLLFFAGLLEILWGVNQTAATAASVVVGITTSFILITTVIPAMQTCSVYLFPKVKFPQCPYKSPQAWIFYQIVAAPLRFFHSAKSTLWGESSDGINELELQNWSGYDRLVYTSHTRSPGAISNAAFGLHWLGRQFLQAPRLAAALYQCIQDPALHVSLRDALKAKGDTRRVSALERAWVVPQSQLNLDATDVELEKLKQAYISDVTVYQTLLHLTEKMERETFSSVLLQERLDLFLKITKVHPDQDIDYPLNDMDKNTEPIPYDIRRGLMQSISVLMREDVGVNESHLRGVAHILELEYQMPKPDIHIFEDAYEALQIWIGHQGWDVDDAEVRETWPQLRVLAIKLERSIHILRRFVNARR